MHSRRQLTPRSPKPAPFLSASLFIAPFLALSLLTAEVRINLRSSVPPPNTHILPITSPAVDLIPNPNQLPPDSGIPPSALPSTHPNYHLLNTIRKSCHISPRWPNFSSMPAVQLRTYGPAYSSIIISDKLKVIYIPVFKVGTTSMMWHIAYLENNPHVLNKALHSTGQLDLVLHEMNSQAWHNHTIYKRTTQQIQRVFQDPSYLKFGFVRNPFDRIISAYLDKIVNWPIHSEEYQKQMWSLYGDDFQKRAEANVSKPTFPHFLQGVASVLRMPRTQTTDPRNRAAYEDNRSRRDMHWRPQVELLHPDLIHLDFVGRFEYIQRDRSVVLEWIYRHTNRRMPVEGAKLHATDPKDKISLYQMLRQNEALQKLVLETYRKDFDTFRFSEHVPDIQ